MEPTKNKRSKLTLKLKTPAGSDRAKLTLKSTEKQSGKSGIQVTIKGRKKDPQASTFENKGLSRHELEARQKALGNISAPDGLKKDFDVNSKIKQDKERIAAEQAIKIAEEQVKKGEVEQKDVTTTPKEPIKKEGAQVQNVKSNYQVDNFDVRSKIKQSIDKQNRDNEERERILAEKKEEEAKKVAKPTPEKDTKKKFRKSAVKSNNFDNEDEKNDKKGKSSFKKDRKNSRRSLQTFIVGNDDNFGSYRKRQKQKNKLQNAEQKEYKKVINEVILPELISVADLSDRMAEKTGDVVKKLFMMGMVATSNQVIDADTAELIIQEFGHNVKRIKESDVEDILNIEEDENIEKLHRAPVVTIMGHVDHGKTSLLDAIRSTDIVSGESGGITQHIGASRIKTKNGHHITFLDTPGHEAFTEMRLRGANATDIVILVVAADDGVKEQTVEAISHAKAAEVPIIVAVNKIDAPGADPARVKNELLKYEIIAEDLSGDVMFVEVSAKERTNLAKLEEVILLQAEMLELKAPYEGKANGMVVETKVDPNKGVIATILIQNGTLNIGDIVVAGTAFGKVRKMHDDKGKNIKEAVPSTPVEILGLNSAPDAGDQFVQVGEEKQARDIISYREKKKRDEKNLKNTAKSAADIFKEEGKSSIKHMPIIIKGDVHGSVEAISNSLMKLNTEEVAIKIIHSATGGVSESDISLASVSGARIIGFNVRANASAKEAARVKEIDISYHSIIYNVVDEIKAMLGGMLDPIKSEEYFGQAEIRQVFKVSGAGKIAGCNVLDGVIKRGAKVRLLRNNVVIYNGALKTLKRFKEDAKEVKSGFECGCALENYDDIKEKDVIECYEIVEKARSL
jgi:translation initiation factor IF-2